MVDLAPGGSAPARLLVVDGVLQRVGRAWTLRAQRVAGLGGPVEMRGYHYGG